MICLLDVGGEGKHEIAWNLNPSPVRTLGSNRGQPIPRRIAGRAEAIPLPDNCVETIILERSPLRKSALYELARVVTPQGTIVLRHAALPSFDPHLSARAILPGRVTQRRIRIGGQILQETCFRLEDQNPR